MKVTIALIAFAINLLATQLTQCSAQLSPQQQAILYNRQGQSISLNNYSPNLQFQNFNQQTYAACLTGMWLFYENPNYNSQPGLMEYVFGPRNKCLNLVTIGGRVSSVRFAGLTRDYTANTMTLYQLNYFQGQEENTIGDLPSMKLDRRVASLIITGRAPWTVYSLPSYQGDAVCIYPPRSNGNIVTPACVYDVHNVNIPHNTIRSIRRGCFSRTTVIASAVHSGSRFRLALASGQNNTSTINGSNDI